MEFVFYGNVGKNANFSIIRGYNVLKQDEFVNTTLGHLECKFTFADVKYGPTGGVIDSFGTGYVRVHTEDVEVYYSINFCQYASDISGFSYLRCGVTQVSSHQHSYS